ncbi:UNVERIFIED_CONTAM: hypothetical protein PYX00_004888 [Menopon gallinae]|uniref:Drebrin-like protein n=1 Tax=Menopon gallinae TaxID=328185 RepID=A0AAW2I6D8_9NEOP
MAINLNKNRESLLAAWKDVLDDKTSTDWALFGYEGLTNDLKVVAKGSGGIEELTEDLNSGKIMYAFLKVMDPKTSLPKNVLINWQGEGAPNVRKGTCANHVRDVSNFFKGAHVTINARTDEEVDPQIIIDKVAKSTGSAYSFKERAEFENDSGPVGTSYKRVIPKQEINAQERDRFWEKEEQEERQRQEAERRRRDEEKRLLEEERKRRESEETAKREAAAKERNRNISQLREAEKTKPEEQKMRRDIVEDIETEEKERRERAEILRRQRSQEAQQLISTRTINARAIFEQNTSALQYNNRKGSLQPNGIKKAEEPSAGEVVAAARKGSLPAWPNQPEAQAVPEEKPSPVIEQNNHEQEQEEEEEQDWEDGVKNNQQIVNNERADQPESEIATQNDFQDAGYGLTARALYDYQAADDTEITFDPGDIITHIDQIDEGWWQGVGPDGVFGLFPANYVELIK